MFRAFRRSLVGVLAAVTAVCVGMPLVAAAHSYVAADITGSSAGGFVVGALLVFAFGWVVLELNRASHS